MTPPRCSSVQIMLIGDSMVLSKGGEYGCKFLAPAVGKERNWVPRKSSEPAAGRALPRTVDRQWPPGVCSLMREDAGHLVAAGSWISCGWRRVESTRHRAVIHRAGHAAGYRAVPSQEPRFRRHATSLWWPDQRPRYECRSHAVAWHSEEWNRAT